MTQKNNRDNPRFKEQVLHAASSSGILRDEREAIATGDKRDGPWKKERTFPSSFARPLFQFNSETSGYEAVLNVYLRDTYWRRYMAGHSNAVASRAELV